MTNRLYDFGHEYVWHCHILSHEENDMMRPVSVRVPLAAPNAPFALGATGTGTGNSRINLTWTDGSINEIGFRVQRQAGGGGFTNVATMYPNITTYSDTALAPNTTYTYRVVAFNTTGDSPPSNTASATTGTFPAVTGVTLTPDLQSPQLPGTIVNFLAVATGGTGSYQYEFQRRVQGGAFAVVQPYSTNPTYRWDTTGVVEAVYEVTVNARNVGSTSLAESAQTITYIIGNPPATGVNITTDLPSPQLPGTAVLFTASGTGSSGYQYRFWLYDGVSWSMVQDYGVGSTWSLPASTPVGNYTIAVDVRSSTAVYRDAVGYLAYQVAVPGPATGVDIITNLPSPQPSGIAVQFTASGVGSFGYQYRFWLYDGVSWSMVQDYGVGDTWSLPASTPAGNYTIAVDVRTSTAVYRDAVGYLPYQVSVPGPATGVDITPDDPSPHPPGTAVLFTASGTGSSGYQYRFWLYDGVSWSMVQDYGVGSTWSLPASTPVGNYTIAVDVRTSTAVYRDSVNYLPYQIQ
jgi:hypothetical protein